jgi:hypothetical protein
VQIPLSTEKIQAWWLRARERFTTKMRNNFDALTLLCSSRLWKNRNAFVFNNTQQQRTMHQMAGDVCEDFRVSSNGRRGVSGVFHVRVGVG